MSVANNRANRDINSCEGAKFRFIDKKGIGFCTARFSTVRTCVSFSLLDQSEGTFMNQFCTV